jgi:hypothetical protein
MWLFPNNAFLSIVADKDDPAGEFQLVRARDIEAVFPKARVAITPKSDYRYRAFVPRADVAKAIAHQVNDIAYTNFKNHVAHG